MNSIGFVLSAIKKQHSSGKSSESTKIRNIVEELTKMVNESAQLSELQQESLRLMILDIAINNSDTRENTPRKLISIATWVNTCK